MTSFPQAEVLTAPVPFAPTSEASTDLYADSGLRRIGLRFAVALVFVRFSMLHQVLPHYIGVNIYLLYIVGAPAIFATIMTRGVQRALQHRTAKYWLLFAVALLIATPFSTWRGGSTQVISTYFKNEFLILFVIAGLVTTWRECRWMLGAIAAGAFVNLITSRLFNQTVGDERFGLEIGTVSDPNDFAAHLLFVLPFLLWLVMTKRSRLVRILALGGLGYGMYLVLASGSRGGVIALVADAVFILVAATRRQRIAVLLAAALVITIAVNVLPATIVQRLTVFDTSDDTAPSEAVGSAISRRKLFEDSVIMTLHHPLFGVGPGQFATVEGEKTHNWHSAHNSYTTAGAETGLLGFIFLMGGVISSWRMVKKLVLDARQRNASADTMNTFFCFRLAMVGFCTAVFFLNFTYFFYLPAIAGLAIALTTVADTYGTEGTAS